ncbi:unnamed protein product [Rotaria socialis]|uniref:Uncharacterized protein n=1 Tax=Rotaria socialis TaxID=392032 RepID=A0A817TBY8_9BILA|nr:unnamed protein product [Rotaria socialis]CAF3681336.1 unnamed protein product [Rotaria socialis]CAF4325238.1 unnamed protein product [Rotaria socialis]CAF4329485.1 unnamed protein product [Rotaria socialis]
MFLKPYQLGNKSKQIYDVFKRNYNLKKLTIQMEKNPHMKKIMEEQLQKRQSQGVLKKLIDKRSSDYKEYFPRSSDPSVIKRLKHVSYDHIGQKRAVHLSKILRSFVADRIGSGEIGDILAGKNFQITNIIVPVDLNRIEILWWSPDDETKIIEDLLTTAGEDLKTAIRHAQLLPSLPPIVFKRDNFRLEHDQINHLLDIVDTGTSDNVSISTNVPERNDLYDSDRTVILRKLSGPTSIDEDDNKNNGTLTDINKLSPEQLQRRMKAFALTKRMKRMQEQRSAIYGIMAIEEERQNDEHFSLNQTTDGDHEQQENEQKSS